ncbi:ankyrin repeat-containing domain protein [Xylariales sp. PMI_506]|nr:ankyrin repeat-containing domain protein [Xylariales sp. PMI_506]
MVEWLLSEGADVKAREGRLGSALGAAAYHDHPEVVACLLEHGADPNLTHREFGNLLQLAALGGSNETIKQLLEAGVDINAKGGTFNTALIAAASREHYDTVSLLLKNGADLSIGSRDYGSSLYQAALAGDTKMVITLLSAGADVNQSVDSEGTPLYAAAQNGSVPVVQLLLRKGADVNKGGRGEYGFPVHVAAEEGHIQALRLLIRAGANLNIIGGHRGVTALEAAVESRDIQVFRAVLEAGADPNIEGGLYENCFHAAMFTGEFRMAEILLERNAQFTDEAFRRAVEVYQDHPSFLERLLERDCNVNAYGGNEGSALHLAVSNRSERAFKLLLAKGAYVDAVVEDGSVLKLAVERESYDLVRELLHRGADPNRYTKDETPFSHAIFKACSEDGDMKLAELLLEFGADIDGANGLALYWAACYDDTGLVLKYLIDKGANLELLNDRDRCTALQGAAKEGKKANLDILLESGANINGTPGDDGFVLHYAIESADESMVNYVLERGALIKDSIDSYSSIDVALKCRRGSIIPLLLENGADINACSPARGMLRFSKDKTSYRMLIDQGAKLRDGDAYIFIDVIQSGVLDDINEMLADGMNPNCYTKYQTPILEVSEAGRNDILEILVDNGADLDQAPHQIQSPLVGACWKSNFRMVECLLEHGANPNGKCQGDVTPLSTSARTQGNLQLVELLLENGADIHVGGEYLFRHASWGGEKILARLLAEPMTELQRANYLNTALETASYGCILDLVGWLLDRGADPNYQGGKYGCPLAAAVSNPFIYQSADINNRRLIIELLLKRGANPNPPPARLPNLLADDGKPKAEFYAPPLTAALNIRSATGATALLAAGADPNLGGGEIPTALQTAARFCSPMVRPLLEAGANPCEVSSSGPFGTALHAAAYAHDLEAVEALLAAGADPNIVAGKYGTALQAAAKLETTRSGWTAGRDSLRCLKALAAAGADVSVQAGKYGSVAQMAAKSGNVVALQWLVEEMKLGSDDIVGLRGGRFGSVRQAAVKKGRWGVVTYLERQFGKFSWRGRYEYNSHWKEFVVAE